MSERIVGTLSLGRATGKAIAPSLFVVFLVAALLGCGKKAPLDPPPVAGLDGGAEVVARTAPPA